MFSKQLAYGLALAAGLALTSSARADDDVIRLAQTRSSSDDTWTLGGTRADLEADTIATGRGGFHGGGFHGSGFHGGGFRGGFHGGGFRGFHTGFRGFHTGFRGFHTGFRGFHRGFYGGFYRPWFYGASYYWPYYSSYYWPSYYAGYGSGFGGYGGYGYGGYYSPYYGGYGYGGYCGISDNGGADTYAICSRRSVGVYYYSSAPQVYQYQYPRYQQPSVQPQAPQLMPRADETFPYDGGPKTPIPMPQESLQPEDARPTVIPYSKLAPGEKLVSLQPKEKSPSQEKKTGKWNYPAYGEQPTRGK
jgi:hypothetical protein